VISLALTDRIKQAWNAFISQDQNPLSDFNVGGAAAYGATSPDRQRLRYSNEQSIVSAIYTRIAIDVAGIEIKHVRLDEKDRYKETIDSGLNRCLTFESNLDQSPRAFRQDIMTTLFDSGVAAIVPVDTTVDPNSNDKFDIHTLRVGTITAWYPEHVRVSLYNEKRGVRQEITLEKKFVAIVENPLYNVMNAPNSTLQRLIRKLNLLDAIDEQSGSGKLDLIIQLPYAIKTDARREMAEQRKKDIEIQLRDSKYGIAYSDATEKITQLNRPAENNLLKQVEFLTNMLYSQLGITTAVMDGTADEKEMLNYFNRTVEPILDAVVESMERTFVGLSGYQRKERVNYYRDPFKLVPIGDIAEIADKFTRNEILSSNEMRQYMGIPPADDPKADELRNSNMPHADDAIANESTAAMGEIERAVEEVFDGLGDEIDKITRGESVT
jgi:hypothetical protein